MEIRDNIRLVVVWKIIILSGMIPLICACSYSGKNVLSHSTSIHPSEYPLLAIMPELSPRVAGGALNKSYPQLNAGKEFPVTGILRVDGKPYRFMGGDSLRISSLAPLANDSMGWSAKYSYLFPGKGWEQQTYDDSLWYTGAGAFGSLVKEFPIHTPWGAENIYVRRYFNIDNVDAIKGHRVYVYYVCDDQMKLYCNGKCWFEKGITRKVKCHQLTDDDIAQIRNGNNVLAAHGHNKERNALLDFGLYIENRKYIDIDTATLKRMDVQVTQTHYVFQCGDVELQIDFVSPSLSEKWDMTGWPVGFLSYQIHTEGGEQHTVEISFDVDVEWMFGGCKVNSWVEQGWRFAKSDSLYLGMVADETAFSSDDGHVILSQNLCAKNANKGVLLLGYGEGRTLQYDGEKVPSLWNKDGSREIKELMKSVGNRYQKLQEDCYKTDLSWNIKAFQKGNKAFAEKMLPSYRDFVSSHRFVLSPDDHIYCFSDTLGNVRDAYESFPTLMFFNRIDWMKSLLDPIFEYCEDIHWVKKYPPYDMGLYPFANKQVKIDDCGVTAAANMLIMTAAIVKVERDFSYAGSHWAQLCLWADYLQQQMKDENFSTIELMDENDDRVKCVLGCMAYQELIRLKEEYE